MGKIIKTKIHKILKIYKKSFTMGKNIKKHHNIKIIILKVVKISNKVSFIEIFKI